MEAAWLGDYSSRDLKKTQKFGVSGMKSLGLKGFVVRSPTVPP